MGSLRRRTIFSEIKSGKSKQEIYDSLVEQNNQRIKVSKLLAEMPSFQRLKKFKNLNRSVAILLGVMCLGYLAIQSYTFGIVYAALYFVVLKYRVKYYYWVAIGSGIGSIVSFLAILQWHPMVNNFLIISLFIFSLNSFVLSIILYRNLYKKPVEKRIVYENEQGQSRSYIEYEFQD